MKTKGFALLVCIAWLTGCATTSTSLDQPELLPSSFGIVAVQVVTNKGRLSPMLDNWTAVHVINVDDPEQRFELKASTRGLLRSRVFVGALPPGRYSLHFLQSFVTIGNSMTWMNAPVPSHLGVFEVEHGILTTLGTVVYQPLGVVQGEERQSELYAVVKVDDPQPLDAFVAEIYPEPYAAMDPSIVLGWETGPELMRSESATRVREAAYGVNAARVGDGRIAFGATLGQIYWREDDGSWSRFDTGYVNELATVEATTDGFVAAGERGLVLVAPALMGPWTRVPGPSDAHAIFWVHQHVDGQFYALARSEKRVDFFQVSPDFDEWKRLHSYAYSPGPYFTGRGQVHAFAQDDGRIVLLGGGERRVFDPRSGQFSVREDDHHFDFAVQPNGTLVSLPGSLWSGVALPQMSTDGGRTWHRTGTARGREYRRMGGSSMPYVLDDGRVLMVMHRAVAIDRLKRRPSEELYTRIGDRQGNIESWGAELEAGCDALLPAISSDEMLFLRCDDGRILSSSDLGQSWQVDRDRVLAPEDVPASERATQTL